MKYLSLLLVALAFTGCTGRQAEQDIAASAAVIHYAAQTLPEELRLQRIAIQANAEAIAKAVGHPIPVKP